MATAITTDQLCRNYINGEWVESKSAKIVERRNPANTDEVVARIPLSTRQDTFRGHADHAGAEGGAGAAFDARGRQGAEGFAGRSAAGDQYSGVYGGRGAGGG